MIVVVGLGNPGEQYARNRHNVGFQSVKFLADRHRLSFSEKKHHARLAVGTIGGQRVVLAKPYTYMNASGQAVASLVRWHKIDPSRDLLVIYDDMDLPFGTLRLRTEGGAGGQNGMKSIIEQLGTQRFPRCRFGVGRPPDDRDPINYLLDNWSREEAEKLPALYSRVADAVELFLAQGLTTAMNRFNTSDTPRRPNRPAPHQPPVPEQE